MNASTPVALFTHADIAPVLRVTVSQKDQYEAKSPPVMENGTHARKGSRSSVLSDPNRKRTQLDHFRPDLAWSSLMSHEYY
jgi:hypothetical protein